MLQGSQCSTAVSPSRTMDDPGYGFNEYDRGSRIQHQPFKGHVPPYIHGLKPINDKLCDFYGPYIEDDEISSDKDVSPRRIHPDKGLDRGGRPEP